MHKEGRVTNPISFTSADILRLLHKHRHSGKNYREVEEWLDVLFSTTIFSEGVVYLANEKRRVKDRFRVFERAVTFGKELPDGKMADKNYVWFSDWQLQNINSNHLLPIDLEAYRKLKNHISKALVPLLQIWLYATRKDGVFEKRYDELCQMLNIRQYRYSSLITRTLSPSLDELTEVGYLADWKIEKTSDGENYKIMFYHGEKFHRDRRTRLNHQHSANGEQANDFPEGESHPRSSRTKESAAPLTFKSIPTVNESLVAELIKRGVTEIHARKILAEIKPEQPVIAQLEWGDFQVQQSGGRITNPAGFYVSLVNGNVSPPPTFETKSQRQAREEKERRLEAAKRETQELETEYEWYRTSEINRFVATIDPQEYAAILEAKRKENQEKYHTAWMVESFAESDAKRELGQRVALMTIAEFKASRHDRGTASSQPEDDLLVSENVSSLTEPLSAYALGASKLTLDAIGEVAEDLLFMPPPASAVEPAIEIASPLPPPFEGGEDSISQLA